MRLIAIRQLCGDYGVVHPGQEFEATDADGEHLLGRNLARLCGEPPTALFGPCPDFSIIIPSRTIENLVPCVEAIHKHDGGHRLIIVDDGLKLNPWPEMLDGTMFVPGAKPFVFARNVNLGIQAAGTDDVILLNDDALLKSPRGFTALSMMAAGHPQFGVISSTVNSAGNTSQLPRPGSTDLREEKRMVCFMAVFIPRRTIDVVGLLDEEFVGYGFEDDSYCVRVRRAGMKIGVYDGCSVDHTKLKSTFRGEKYPTAKFQQNAEIFRRKYGASNHQV